MGFHIFADEMVARLKVRPGMRVLETACGTGIVTGHLVTRLAEHGGSLVATDLNEPMLAYAATKMPKTDRLEWRQADATKLSFDDRSFDSAVCQFGLMFFPDKAAGVREALRVLKPGGRFLVSVWGRLEDHPVQRITHETLAAFFPLDPPQFYTVPFSLHDATVVSRLLEDSGFEDVRWERPERVGQSPSAAEAVIGLIEGNPIYLTIMERAPSALADIKATLAKNLVAALGDHPLRCQLHAVFFSACRPAG
jgi:ubiquinone/menaquinone biosynthesis C-methylase UbiE